MNDLILSNFDIFDICNELNINLIDCVAKDKLVFLPKRNGGYIINLDNSNRRGTHWVALYLDNNICCYFDSYGSIYPNEVRDFVGNKVIIYNTNVIQDLKDNFGCGWYCIAFIHYLQQNNNKNKNLYDELNGFIRQFNLNNSKKSILKLKDYYKHIKYN